MRRWEEGKTGFDQRDAGREEWGEELEAAGRTAVFFLLLPVLLVTLLLVGCGDSGGERVNGASESEAPAATTLETGPRGQRTTASGRTPVERPDPPTPGESARSQEDGSDVGDEKDQPFTGPVSFADAERAYDEARYDRAHRMFSAYTQQYPDNPWGFYMTGLSAWKKGDLDRAEKALEKTVEMDSSHVKGWVNLARVRLDAGRPGAAKEAVDRALKLEGGETSDVLRVVGRVAQEEGELDEATDAYRKALILDPDDAWSMNNLALIHIHRGDFEGALPPLARAVQIRDDVAVFHNNLGTALEKVGRFSDAAEAYRKADTVGTGYEKAKASLARVEGLKEPPGMKPTELSEFARSFTEQVEEWSRERTAALDASTQREPQDEQMSEQEGEQRSEQVEKEDPGPAHTPVGSGAGEESPTGDDDGDVSDPLVDASPLNPR